jgi:hypothetical protein
MRMANTLLLATAVSRRTELNANTIMKWLPNSGNLITGIYARGPIASSNILNNRMSLHTEISILITTLTELPWLVTFM